MPIARREIQCCAGILMVLLALVLPSIGRAAAVSGCGWPVKSDANIENIAYPDQDATYWATPFEAIPGAEMTITAHFPLARYMSFNIYEGDAAVDSLTDDQIRPSTGENPYVAGDARNANGSYSLHVVLGKPPAKRAANTLYAGSLNGEPNPVGLIIYRLYLPQGDATGGVPLPTVTYTSLSSETALPCADTSAVDKVALNQLLATSSSPATVDAATTSLTWGISNSHTSSQLTLGQTTVHSNYDGNFNNRDNTYVSLLAEKIKGDVIAFRAKAPTYDQTVGASVMPSAQVRYFSICTNELASTRFVSCLPDQSLKRDSQGYFTVVISDTAHKPANLSALDNWIPAGPYPDIFVLFRQMVPSPAFTQASANVLSSADAPGQMGDYYPRTVQCSTASFQKTRCGLPVPRAPATSKPEPGATVCRRHTLLSFRQHPAAPVREVRAVVEIGGRVVKRVHARSITRVNVKRPARATFTVKLIATLSNREVISHIYTYRGCVVTASRTVKQHPANSHR